MMVRLVRKFMRFSLPLLLDPGRALPEQAPLRQGRTDSGNSACSDCCEKKHSASLHLPLSGRRGQPGEGPDFG